MDDGKTVKKSYKLDGEDVIAVQGRLNQAEYALEILSEHHHNRVEKLLGGITSNYRVANNRKALEEFHTASRGNNPRDEVAYDKLIAQSKAAGTIRSTFVNGDIDIEMITVDINQAEILARSSKEHAGLILQAIGLTANSDISPLLLQALGLDKKK